MLVWFPVGTFLVLALQGGANLSYMLFECVGGEVAGGISVDRDEGLRDFDEAADGGNEFVPVRRDEGHFGFDFLCVRRMVGWVKECVDCIGVQCVGVGWMVVIVEEWRWWAVRGYDLADGGGCCIHGGDVVRYELLRSGGAVCWGG